MFKQGFFRTEEQAVEAYKRWSKDTTAAIIRTVLKLHQATRVVAVTEAWMQDVPKAKPLDLERLDREGVRNQPGRVEVVLIMGEDATEGGVMARMPILRQGRKARLGPRHFVRYDSGEGRMVGLLPQAGAAH